MEYYTINQLCQLAGISRQWLNERYTRRDLGPPRVYRPVGKGFRVLYPVIEADRWIAEQWLKSDKRASGRKSNILNLKGTSHENRI